MTSRSLRMFYERPFPETSAMRLPRFRFTVRRVMVAVAVLGLLFGVEMIRRRWKYKLLMANYHASEEMRMRLLLSGGWITETDEAGKRQKLRIGRNIEREPVRRRLMYHVVMGDRYQRAARRPWLAVASDLPEPKIAQPVLHERDEARRVK
jgi:hypothetical protein